MSTTILLFRSHSNPQGLSPSVQREFPRQFILRQCLSTRLLLSDRL